jgi:protoporphyrinogen/coproporphyrinogen III oxidase
MNHTNKSTGVLIIGAGLTGLSLGFLLKRRNIDFLIVEMESRAGGVINTKQHNGFTYETGPNTGIIAHPEVVELFEMLAPECEIELADPKAENRWILKNGQWKNLPSGLISGIFTPLFSLYDKFRILGEPFRKRGTNPMETVSELVKRRMGQSFLDYAVDPFISGIYAGDPDQLVTQYALPKLYALEQKYGSFIKGAIKKAREPRTERDLKANRKVFAAKGGFNNLIMALTRQIGEENIIYSAKNIKISHAGSSFSTAVKVENGELLTIQSQKLITTSGGHSLADLFDFIDRDELEAITKLKYARVVQLIMAFNKWNGPELNAFGGLVPSKEKRNFLGVLFPSSIFGGRTPEGGALLSVFFGGMKRPDIYDMNDEEIYKLADLELSELFDLPKSDLAFKEIYRYRHAIPQYDNKSPERLKRIIELQTKYPGLILAGNIRDGIGIGDRIRQAFDISGLIN